MGRTPTSVCGQYYNCVNADLWVCTVFFVRNSHTIEWRDMRLLNTAMKEHEGVYMLCLLHFSNLILVKKEKEREGEN